MLCADTDSAYVMHAILYAQYNLLRIAITSMVCISIVCVCVPVMCSTCFANVSSPVLHIDISNNATECRTYEILYACFCSQRSFSCCFYCTMRSSASLCHTIKTSKRHSAGISPTAEKEKKHAE